MALMSAPATAGPVSTTAEHTLVARARVLEPGAWAEIYTAYYGLIYRYARARIFDDSIAEDVTSAVFLSALEGIRSYRERGRPLLAWLYAIARNTVADEQRRAVSRDRISDRLFPWRGSRDKSLGTVQSSPQLGSSADDPGTNVEQLDLWRTVNQLPEPQREVVVLRHFVGLSTPEIALAMHKKPSAVYSLEARALTTLRKKMAPG